MKNYKVMALRTFTDALEKVERKVNDVFECTKERYEFLKDHNAVELIEVQETIDEVIKEVEEEKVIPVKKTNKKKSK